MLRFLRRALVALGLAALVATVLRARNGASIPPTTGGWRQLEGPELR